MNQEENISPLAKDCPDRLTNLKKRLEDMYRLPEVNEQYTFVRSILDPSEVIPCSHIDPLPQTNNGICEVYSDEQVLREVRSLKIGPNEQWLEYTALTDSGWILWTFHNDYKAIKQWTSDFQRYNAGELYGKRVITHRYSRPVELNYLGFVRRKASQVICRRRLAGLRKEDKDSRYNKYDIPQILMNTKDTPLMCHNCGESNMTKSKLYNHAKTCGGLDVIRDDQVTAGRINPLRIPLLNRIEVKEVGNPFKDDPHPLIKLRLYQQKNYVKLKAGVAKFATYIAIGLPKHYGDKPDLQEKGSLHETIKSKEKLRQWLHANAGRIPKIYVYVGSTVYQTGTCNAMINNADGSLRTLSASDMYVAVVKRIFAKSQLESENLEAVLLTIAFGRASCIAPYNGLIEEYHNEKLPSIQLKEELTDAEDRAVGNIIGDPINLPLLWLSLTEEPPDFGQPNRFCHIQFTAEDMQIYFQGDLEDEKPTTSKYIPKRKVEIPKDVFAETRQGLRLAKFCRSEDKKPKLQLPDVTTTDSSSTMRSTGERRTDSKRDLDD